MPDHFGVGKQLRADHLDGDDPLEQTVPRPEHLAGPAFAEAVEEDVRRQTEFRPSPVEELIDLIGREPAAPSRALARPRGSLSGARLRLERFELGWFEQPQLGQRSDQEGYGVDGHGRRQPWSADGASDEAGVGRGPRIRQGVGPDSSPA